MARQRRRRVGPERSRRRVVLGCASGLLAALGGCLGTNRDRSGTSTTASTRTPATATAAASSPSTTAGTTTGAATTSGRTTTTTTVEVGTTRTVDGTPVTVRSVLARNALLYWQHPDALGVASPPEGRYVAAEVEAGPDGPEREAFDLLAGGRSYPTTSVGGFGLRSTFGESYRPSAGTTEGWVLFVAPAPLRGRRPRIAVGATAWRLPGPVVERLATPEPTFELAGFGVPDVATVGDPISVTVTARNTSDRTGTVRAAVVATGGGLGCCLSVPVAFDVEAGGRASTTVAVGAERSDDLDPRFGPVTVRLKTPGETREASVPVRDPDRTTTRGDAVRR